MLGGKDQPSHRGEARIRTSSPARIRPRPSPRSRPAPRIAGRSSSSEGRATIDPVPRWSNRITRANDARRRWKRYNDGSASIESNGIDRARQHEQIDRALAEHLVGDVHVAALGVASPRSLRHSVRLAPRDDTIEPCRAIVLRLMRVQPSSVSGTTRRHAWRCCVDCTKSRAASIVDIFLTGGRHLRSWVGNCGGGF